MFDRFNAAGVRYCVLHSYDRLPEFTASDVDMAVDKVGLKKVDRIVFELAEELGFKVIQKLYYDVPHSYYYVLFFRDAEGLPGFIQLDFMNDELGIGRYLLKTRDLLTGRRKLGELYIPSAPAEACYLLIKKVVKQSILPEHQAKLKASYAKDSRGVEWLLKRYFGRKNLPRIRRLIFHTEPEKEVDILRILKTAITMRHRLLRPHLMVLKGLWLAKRVFERIIRPTGLVVTLLSPDGGGKSAVADQILSRMRPGFRRTKRIHWRPNWLPPPRKILRPRYWKIPESPNYEPHALPPKGRYISILRFLYYVTDYVLGFFPKILWPKIRTALVVTERYYYDFLVDTGRFRLDLPPGLPRRLLPIIPKPDVVVLLNGPCEVIHRRKQEITLNEIKRQLQTIRSISPYITDMYEVRLDQPFFEEIAAVEDVVIGQLANRLRKRIGLR